MLARYALRLGVAALVAAPGARSPMSESSPASGDVMPSSRLAVWADGRWRTFWSATHAPHAWTGDVHPALHNAVVWRQAAPGVELAELRLSGSRSAWRLRVVLLRLDPQALDFALQFATREGGLLGGWTVDAMPADARVAFNAGQFDGGMPWGWRVEDGREVQPPGTGPLAMAVVVDGNGRVRLLQPEQVEEARGSGDVRVAFQSYPALLVDDGTVPVQLRAAGRGVDLSHRDTRLGLGVLRDGRVLVALTRFDALGESAGRVPFGPTTPEMAALLGALGCTRAVLLDGGLSAQLAVRGDGGAVQAWRGLRRVPLALVAATRSP
jgi:hypothetical protein